MATPAGDAVFADLVANAVHDVKNSLALVLNSAESLTDGETMSPAAQRALLVLQHEARRANADLMSLLGLFKLERGRPLVQPMVVECEDLLSELVAYNATLLAHRGIEKRANAQLPRVILTAAWWLACSMRRLTILLPTPGHTSRWPVVCKKATRCLVCWMTVKVMVHACWPVWLTPPRATNTATVPPAWACFSPVGWPKCTSTVAVVDALC